MMARVTWCAAFAAVCGCAIAVGAVQTGSPVPELYQALPFRFIGPTGNRIVAVAGVPGDPSVIYAGAASGGLFKTTDAGLHWQPLFDNQNVASIGAVAVARSNANVVWVGTGEAFIRGNVSIGNGIYKSTDAGKSWTHMGLENTGRIVRVVREDLKRQGLLYAGTENALHVSFDDGASWLPFRNNMPPVAISWMVVQEDFNDLVISTYGRGFWIFDDLSPFQQMTAAVLQSKSFLRLARTS